MERFGFTMQLKKGFEAEYERRHDEIWPDLKAELNQAGIREYSIFLNRATGTLFAFHKAIPEHQLARLPTLPIMKKWWAYMSDLMETNEDNSPKVTSLREVFYLP